MRSAPARGWRQRGVWGGGLFPILNQEYRHASYPAFVELHQQVRHQ